MVDAEQLLLGSVLRIFPGFGRSRKLATFQKRKSQKKIFRQALLKDATAPISVRARGLNSMFLLQQSFGSVSFQVSVDHDNWPHLKIVRQPLVCEKRLRQLQCHQLPQVTTGVSSTKTTSCSSTTPGKKNDKTQMITSGHTNASWLQRNFIRQIAGQEPS